MWLFFSVVYLHSALLLNNLITLSAPDDKIYLLSGENATVKTSFECPTNLDAHDPVSKFHRRRSWSQDEEIKNLLSFERAKSVTKCEWPYKDFFG